MYDKVLVPLDGSGFAETALPTALALTRQAGGTIHLVTVREPLPSYARVEWDEEIHGAAERYLASVVARLEGAGVEATWEVVTGPVADTLVDHGEEVAADLAVMTTHGRGPLSRAWLGSVADAFVRHASYPILLLRPDEDEDAEEPLPGALPTSGPRATEPIEPGPPFRKVLVPLDGSELAETILETVLGVTGTEGVEYLLLRMVPYPHDVASPYLPDTIQHNVQELEAWQAEAEAYLGRVADGLPSELEVRPVVMVGSQAAMGIRTVAREEEVDLVAMATHGRGGLSRMVLGSVADKVIRSSHAPLLLRRPGG